MPAMTDSFENDIINYFLRGQDVSGGTAYLALSTTTPSETGSFTEPNTAYGYSRQLLGLGAPSGGSGTNQSTITFGPCVTTNWGSIVAVGIFFEASGGSLKMYKTITPKSVSVGQTIAWTAGILTVSFD